MKYFEVDSPYYSLLKANTKEEAKAKYIEIVCDDYDGTLNDDLKEVSRDYALIKFSRGQSEDMKHVSAKEVEEEFNSESADVLLITSELI